MTNLQDEKREERALDALIVAALRADIGKVPPPPDQGFPDLTEEDRRALDALGPDFIKRLLAGQQPSERPSERESVQRELTSASMHRGGDEGKPTDKAREEMEQRIKENEERKDRDRDA